MSQLAHQSMDLSEELERIIQEMEWSDVLDSLQVVVDEILGEEPNTSSPPPTPPAEKGINIHPQPVEMLQYNNEHVSRLPQVMEENLVPVGTVNGEVVYGIPPDRFAPCASPSFAPPLFAPVSQKRQHEGHQHEGRPYIKKPPNAFMLFRKEQRPKVVAELKVSDSATVNAVLGQRWKLMSKEEQAKYYEEADKERRLHAQLFPDWSSRDNYGKKRKRVRSKAPNRAEASASKPEDVTQRAKKPCVTSVQTATLEPCSSNAVGVDYPHCHSVMTEPPASQTFAVGAPHTQAVVMEAPSPLTVRVKLPPMDTPVTVPVCVNCNLPYVMRRLKTLATTVVWSMSPIQV